MSSRKIQKTVVAVLMPREHLPFIRQWCQHHLDQGWRIFLYDNTGSQGSTRATSSFTSGRHQTEQTDKRGNRYGRHTEAMSDAEVQAAFRQEIAGLDVTMVPWQPLDPSSGRIVHGQVEAYVDFIRNHAEGVEWAAFIDADEYLHSGPGFDWDALLEEAGHRACHRIMIEGIIYESRWSPEGAPRPMTSLACSGAQSGGQKNIVRPSMTLRADIHWGWQMRDGNEHATPDIIQYHFRHYNGLGPALRLKICRSSDSKLEAESLPISPEVPDHQAEQPSPATRHELPPLEHYSRWQISGSIDRYMRTELPRALPSPSRILELGPGASTLLLSQLYPAADIVAIEHDATWHSKASAYLAKATNVDLRLCPLVGSPSWYDLTPSLLGSFHLLFVDGPPGGTAPGVREGALCLAGNLLPAALVILNNTDRFAERSAVRKWCEAGCKIISREAKFTVLRYPGEL